MLILHHKLRNKHKIVSLLHQKHLRIRFIGIIPWFEVWKISHTDLKYSVYFLRCLSGGGYMESHQLILSHYYTPVLLHSICIAKVLWPLCTALLPSIWDLTFINASAMFESLFQITIAEYTQLVTQGLVTS